MRTAKTTKAKFLALRKKGLTLKEAAAKLGVTAGYCQNLIGEYKKNQFFKDSKWLGEHEPNWDHDISEKCRHRWFEANQGISC